MEIETPRARSVAAIRVWYRFCNPLCIRLMFEKRPIQAAGRVLASDSVSIGTDREEHRFAVSFFPSTRATRQLRFPSSRGWVEREGETDLLSPGFTSHHLEQHGDPL